MIEMQPIDIWSIALLESALGDPLESVELGEGVILAKGLSFAYTVKIDCDKDGEPFSLSYKRSPLLHSIDQESEEWIAVSLSLLPPFLPYVPSKALASAIVGTSVLAIELKQDVPQFELITRSGLLVYPHHQLALMAKNHLLGIGAQFKTVSSRNYHNVVCSIDSDSLKGFVSLIEASAVLEACDWALGAIGDRDSKTAQTNELQPIYPSSSLHH